MLTGFPSEVAYFSGMEYHSNKKHFDGLWSQLLEYSKNKNYPSEINRYIINPFFFIFYIYPKLREPNIRVREPNRISYFL